MKQPDILCKIKILGNAGHIMHLSPHRSQLVPYLLFIRSDDLPTIKKLQNAKPGQRRHKPGTQHQNGSKGYDYGKKLSAQCDHQVHHPLHTVVVPSGGLSGALMDIQNLRTFQHLIVQAKHLVHTFQDHLHPHIDKAVPGFIL